MKHEIAPRTVSALVMAAMFAFAPWLIGTTKTSIIELQRAEAVQFYETTDMVEFLQASLTMDVVDDEFYRVTFSRTAPFYIPATQKQMLQVFCNGTPYKLRTREPFSINMDEGLANVALTYRFDQWGIEKAPDNISGCTLNLTRLYSLTLPHNVERTMELKATYVLE